MQHLGKAFGDDIFFGKRSGKHRATIVTRGWGARLTIFYALLIVGGFILVGRLFHLTVIQGGRYRTLSEGNRISETIIHAPRGIIFDRHGEPLTRNIPAYRLITPCPEYELGCVSILSQDDMLVREATASGEGVVTIDVQREYLYPESFAHVLGFLSEITSDELADNYFVYQNYHLGDRIGRDGVEKSWERTLRGVDGKELVEIDAAGNTLRSFGRKEAVPGKNITLTIDRDVQQVAFDALGDRNGAVVASVPETGEILALVSNPSYDTNRLQQGITQAEYEALLNDPDRPLFNRAIGGVYPPGSTFKLITAIAALEEDVIDEQTQVDDIGTLRIGRYMYSNWYFTQYGKTEGLVRLVKALARSNDIYFYKTGEWLGIEDLAKWARRFGLGQVSGIAIDGEVAGVMPDPDWRKENRGDDWFLGDTYHAAIGQGDIQTTPLQVNLFTNVIANGGMLCKPILEKSQNSRSNDQTECTNLKIQKDNLALVREGMRRACDAGSEETYMGTGWPLFEFDPPIACKTGTAEFNDPDDKTHAWFTAFGPIDDPEITVTVLLEKGGEGSTDAGPVAKSVLQEWFER